MGVGGGEGSDGTETTLAAVEITFGINAGISLKVVMDLGIVLVNQGISGSTILVQEYPRKRLSGMIGKTCKLLNQHKKKRSNEFALT
jgi:hypothetical protein